MDSAFKTLNQCYFEVLHFDLLFESDRLLPSWRYFSHLKYLIRLAKEGLSTPNFCEIGSKPPIFYLLDNIVFLEEANAKLRTFVLLFPLGSEPNFIILFDDFTVK